MKNLSFKLVRMQYDELNIEDVELNPTSTPLNQNHLNFRFHCICVFFLHNNKSDIQCNAILYNAMLFRATQSQVNVVSKQVTHFSPIDFVTVFAN